MPFPATHPALARALEAQGYLEPTPVQAAVLEAGDQDLLVSAQTGSGKTVAFGLAAAIPLLGEAESFGRGEAPLCLAIAPTRELALQVSRELSWLYAPANARVVTCVGGMDARREQRDLANGCHIVVGTPGRLRDHIERGNLDLSALKVVVLDEADEMLDLGFREDLEEILDSTPADRRTYMFSATIAKDIATLAKRYQRDALRIDTIRRDEAHGDIEYRAIRVAPTEIEHAVVNVLRYFEAPGALVFCATREAVRRLYGALRERGFAAVALSGELSQKERADALQALRDGHARACVATDVAARGLDLPDLGLVIHAEMPVNKAGLLHRSGRTGRAGKKGVSVVIVPHNKRRRAEQLFASANIEATWQGPPTAEEVRAKDQVRLLSDPLLTEVASPEDLELANKILADSTPEAVAAALIRLYRSRLPEPEELSSDDVRGYQPSAPREPRKPYEPRPDQQFGGGDMAWFRLTIGRRANADPKWLIPLICRMGHVTKKDIGSIRIFDHETKFEISREREASFSEAVKAAGESKGARIEPTNSPGPKQPRRDDDTPYEARPPRPAYDKGPREERPPRPAYEKRANDERPPRQDFNKSASDERPPRKDFHKRPSNDAAPRPGYDPLASDAAPAPRKDYNPPGSDDRARKPYHKGPPKSGDGPKGPHKAPYKAKFGGPKPSPRGPKPPRS